MYLGPPLQLQGGARCLRLHQNHYNTDDYNSNDLEELRRKHKTYKQTNLKRCSKSIVATLLSQYWRL